MLRLSEKLLVLAVHEELKVAEDEFTASLLLVDLYTGEILTETRTEAKINCLAKVQLTTCNKKSRQDLVCVGSSSDHFSSAQRSKKKSKLGKGVL